MKRAIWLLLLGLVATEPVLASSGGSAYSILGIGDLRYFPGIKSHGMGYASMGLSGPATINPFSPGSWSRITNVRFEASMLYEGFGADDGQRSLYRSTVNFNGALFAFPISTVYGTTFVGGFLPYSAINYNNYTGGSQSGINYALNHYGSGGVSLAMGGLSVAPFRGLSLGGSFGYLFGNSERTRAMISRTPDGSAASGGLERINLSVNGFTAQVGVLVDNLGGIADLLRPFSIGISYTTGADLNTKQRSYYEYAAERDSSGQIEGTRRIPARLGAGVACMLGTRYQIAADIVAQPWASSSSPSLKDSYRYCLGAERLPSPDPTAPWVEHVSCRAGATWYETPYFVNGRAVNEWTVTLGFGLPLTHLTRLETSFEYGSRGTTEDNLIRDEIFRFNIGFSLGEIWFVRPEEE